MPYKLIITSDGSNKLNIPYTELNLFALMKMFPVWDQHFPAESGYQISIKRLESEHPAVTREQFSETLRTGKLDETIDLFYHEDEFLLFISRKHFQSIHTMTDVIDWGGLEGVGVTGQFVYAAHYTILQQFTDHYTYEVPTCNNISDTDLLSLEKMLFRAYLSDRHSLAWTDQEKYIYIAPWVYKNQIQDCATVEEFCSRYFRPDKFAEVSDNWREGTVFYMNNCITSEGYAFIHASDSITGKRVCFIPPAKTPC